MEENRLTTYRISEAARELGISAEWLRVGEKRGFFPPALRDRVVKVVVEPDFASSGGRRDRRQSA